MSFEKKLNTIHLNENASHYIVITVIADWRLLFLFCFALLIGAGVRGWRFSFLLGSVVSQAIQYLYHLVRSLKSPRVLFVVMVFIAIAL